MPELTDEHIEDLFQDLRAGEISRVQPPGVTAARTTVRRRRTVTSVVTAVAVIAVVGGIAVTASPDRKGSAPATDIGRRHEAMVALSQRASEAVEARAPEKGVEARSGPLETILADPPYRAAVLEASGIIPADEYSVVIACAGSGTMFVHVETERSSHTLTVDCTSTPIADETGPIQSGGTYSISLSSVHAVQRDTGFAYKLVPTRSALTKRAEAKVKSVTPGGEVLHRSGKGDISFHHLSQDEAPPGQYSLRLACTDIGAMKVTAQHREGTALGEDSMGGVLASRTVACSADPVVVELSFSFDRGAVSVALQPSSTTPEHIGYAYSLART